MHQFEDYSDLRNKGWCVHCTHSLRRNETSRDHVPTKSLLAEPHPTHLPQVNVCRACNMSFSLDEQYFVAFLGSVVAGTTDPKRQTHPPAGRILARNPGLRKALEKAKREYKTLGGDIRQVWTPDYGRIHRVVIKNARGHVLYELGEPMLQDPESVFVTPLEFMQPSEREEFEKIDHSGLWPEVGSRLMTRIATGYDMVDGWINVQEQIYRYSVKQSEIIAVRSVIHNYIATEVIWAS